MQLLRHLLRITWHAYDLFVEDDGWAIASHIALSMLMTLFPFLIVVTALTGFLFGSKELADEAARILLEAWPAEVARPIAADLHNVLTEARGDLLTVGAAFSVYFASSGVESLRIVLTRAYDGEETRPWRLLRLESIGYVLLAAVALIALAFLVVLGPLIFATAVRHAPWLEPFEQVVTFARLAVASIVLIVALLLAHLWLPAGRCRLRDVAPGLLATLALWLAGGSLFGRYLAQFANSYVSTYAGLASAMVALVFLYWSASIFVFGGELNAAIRGQRSVVSNQQ